MPFCGRRIIGDRRLCTSPSIVANRIPNQQSTERNFARSKRCCLILDSLTEDGDLFLHLNPEYVFVQVIVVTAVTAIIIFIVVIAVVIAVIIFISREDIIVRLNTDPLVLTATVRYRVTGMTTACVALLCDNDIIRLARDSQQRGDKCLLHIREAELVRNLGDGLAQLVREFDLIAVAELLLPEVAVGDALLQVWVWEEVFPVEAGGAFLSQMLAVGLHLWSDFRE